MSVPVTTPTRRRYALPSGTPTWVRRALWALFILAIIALFIWAALYLFSKLPASAGTDAGDNVAVAVRAVTNGAEVSWKAQPGASGYEILRNGESLVTVGADKTSYLDKTAQRGQTYHYDVVAKAPAIEPTAQAVPQAVPQADSTNGDVTMPNTAGDDGEGGSPFSSK